MQSDVLFRTDLGGFKQTGALLVKTGKAQAFNERVLQLVQAK